MQQPLASWFVSLDVSGTVQLTAAVFHAHGAHRTFTIMPKHNARLMKSSEFYQQLFHDLDGTFKRRTYPPPSQPSFVELNDDGSLTVSIPSPDMSSSVICFTQDARADRVLVVPQTEPICVPTIYSVNTGIAAGTELIQNMPNAFRWDLFSMQRFRFPHLARIRRAEETELHDCALHFATDETAIVSSGVHVGIDGTVFRDYTHLRVVKYLADGIFTIPLIAGAYLVDEGALSATSPVRPPTHMRFGGGNECHFEEILWSESNGSNTYAVEIIDDVGLEEETRYIVHPSAIEMIGNEMYVECHRVAVVE